MYSASSLSKIILGLVLILVSALTLTPAILNLGANNHNTLNIGSCVADVISKLYSTSPTFANYQVAHDYCSIHTYSELVIQDFKLRRSAYALQGIMGQVILWMVVIITLSGVGLASMQLFASYRLAEKLGSNPQTDATTLGIEPGKLVISTSVSGLMVLIVSFAFFYVFVSGVYKMDDSSNAQPTSVEAKLHSALGQGPRLSNGKLEREPDRGAK